MKGKITVGKEAAINLLKSLGCQILEPIDHDNLHFDIADAFENEWDLRNYSQAVYFIHPNGKHYCFRCDIMDARPEFVAIEIENGIACRLQHVRDREAQHSSPSDRVRMNGPIEDKY